jgi:pentatricopeptide repeat protein
MAILLPLSHQKKKKVMLTTLCSVNPFLVVENRTQSNASNISPTNLRSLCDQGRLREALDTLHLVDSLFNSSAYVLLLQACIKKKALAEAKLIHAHINQTAFVPDRYLLHTLMNMYAKCRRLVDARRIFDQMPVRDAFSWSLMIAAYARQGPAEEALALFRQIQRAGVQPDVFIFASVIPACSTLDELKDVHKEIISNGFQLDVFVGSTLLDMYAKRGSLEDARDVFEKMPQRDVVSWNSMIAAYVKEGLYEEALELFYQMQRTGMCPSEFTFASVLPACANLTALAQGMEIHGGIIRSGIQCDTFVANALVDMYAKCGSIEKARDVFDRMRQRDVVSWTSMIAGYAQHGYSEAALKLFQKMRLAGVKPNSKTFASVIPACANLANLEKGMEIDEELTGSGYQSDLVVTNALIYMYAKCGIIEKA